MPKQCSIPLPFIWKNSAPTIGLRCEDSRGGIVVGDWMPFNNQMKTSIPHGGNGHGEGDSEEIVDNIVGGENTVEYKNNDNFEWGKETNEANLQVVNFHSIPDKIMGMILSMLDGYDLLKGPIWICWRFIEIYNNTQLYVCPSLIQRPGRTWGGGEYTVRIFMNF